MIILIIDAGTDGNIGSGALVENSAKLLRKYFPSAEIEILAQNPEYIQQFSGIRTYPELFLMPFNQPRIKQFVWLIKTVLWMLTHIVMIFIKKIGLSAPLFLYTYDRKKRIALSRIMAADMIVSIGAERINDNFYKAILFSLYTLWLIKLYGKFIVLFPQTIGPFHYKMTRYMSAKVLNLCDVIFLRDEKSKEYIKELCITKAAVIDTCDVAVLQESATPEIGEKILSKAGIFHDRPLVGISAMHWSYVKAKGKSRYEDYRTAIAKVADDLISKEGVQIVFLATNVLVHGCREDDVSVAMEIKDQMVNKGDAYVIEQLCTPSEMKSILGLFEMCLVTRMHACIFSTGIFTPTFSINYQFKLKEYMKLMGLEDYTINIDEVTYEGLKHIAEKTWNDRGKIRTILQNKIKYWQSNLYEAVEKLPTIYKKRRGIFV